MASVEQEATELAKSSRVDWDCFVNSTVLITGVTGLIGSCCVRALLERNKIGNSNIKVYGLVRSIEKAKKLLGKYASNSNLVLISGDIATVSFEDEAKIDYIIHAACPTASNFFVNNPVETIDTIVCGTKNMLEIAKKYKASLVYVSSMEVYGQGNSEQGSDFLLDESSVGYVDPLLVRNCYPEGKRLAENYCVAYASEFNLNTYIVRLAQTFGSGITKSDKRIFASFARAAQNGENIILKTTGQSTRMYVHTFDAVAAIFTVLVQGKPGCAYNVANKETYCSIADMAEMVVKEFSRGDMEIIIDVDPDAPYPPEHHLPLDTSSLLSLGWSPKYNLKDMYSDLIECLA